MHLKPHEVLAELDLHWIPESVRGDVSWLLKDAKGRVHQVLVTARDMLREDAGVGGDIEQLRHRVLTAVSHALGRRGSIDWKNLLQSEESEAFHTLKAVGVNEAHAEAPHVLHNAYGVDAVRSVRNRFGANGHFKAWWEERQEDEEKKLEEQSEQEFNVIASQVLQCKPEDMSMFLRGTGLPADALRNQTWIETLWNADRPTVRRHLDFFRRAILQRNDADTFLKTGDWKNIFSQLSTASNSVTPKARDHFMEYVEQGDSPLSAEDRELFLPFDDEAEGGNPWKSMSAYADLYAESGLRGIATSNEAVLLVAHGVTACREAGPVSCEMIDWCDTPEQFRSLFRILGLSSEQWEHAEQLRERDPDLFLAVQFRFGSHAEFVQWMKCSASFDSALRQKVRRCRSGEDLRALAQELGVQGDAWKGEAWMLTRSSEETGNDLSSFVHALQNHPRLSLFNAHEGQTYPDIMRNLSRVIVHIEQAWDSVYRHCEEFGMSLEELLRVEHSRLFEHCAELRSALRYIEQNEPKRS